MKFLLTNDDGIDAEGLSALEQALSGLGQLMVMAPSSAYSGCGHQLTTHRPLRAKEHAERRFSVDGSPADCTRLGLTQFMQDADWVVSGINHGGNLGSDVFPAARWRRPAKPPCWVIGRWPFRIICGAVCS